MIYTNPPARQVTRQKSYRRFLGVDMSTAVTEVDDRRSPYAPNMIADEGGFPCKRPGHERFMVMFPIDSTETNRTIHGIHKYNGTLYIHAGTKLFRLDMTEPAPGNDRYGFGLLYSGMNDAPSTSFVADGKLFILDGKRMIYIDGKPPIKMADENGYIPTTAKSMKPTGGGTKYEDVNLLSPYRTNSYWVNSTNAAAKTFSLDAQNIDGIKTVEVMNASGRFVETTAYTVNNIAGIVTFNTAPGASPIEGEDNVRITYKRVVNGYADRINKCRIYASYGINADIRMFLSGNPDFKNYDWYCASGNPLYYPDTGYSVIGSGSTAIMGYLRQYDALVIIKQEGNNSEPTAYLRTATLDQENKTIFPLRQGISGAGAVSMYAVTSFNDDNVFLTEDGVRGLDTQQITQQRSMQERAEYVSVPLRKEPNKENALFCTGGGYLYLFINGHVYVADGRQKNASGAGSFGYEWYYWTDVPATCAAYMDGRLYFGDKDGGMYYFKDEKTFDVECYSDSDIYYATKLPPKPIYAAWSTKMDRLGNSSLFKKITKTGTGAVIKPYAKTSGTICYVCGDTETEAKRYSYTTVLDFDNIDFDNFDFGKLPNPYFVPARKKKRKAKMFQMKVENNELNSPFGLYEMRVNYILCGYIRN